MDKTKNTPQVHPFVRLILTIMVTLGSYLSLLYLYQIWQGETDSFSLFPKSIEPLLCLPLGYAVWKNLGGNLHARITYGTFGGLILGGIGLLLGILIPVLFKMGVQGPMIGILLTGPIGFLLGTILGILYWKKTFIAKQTDPLADLSDHPKTL